MKWSVVAQEICEMVCKAFAMVHLLMPLTRYETLTNSHGRVRFSVLVDRAMDFYGEDML